MNENQVRKLAEQILRMRRFVARQEETIRAKVHHLAEATGRSVDDAKALIRAYAAGIDAEPEDDGG